MCDLVFSFENFPFEESQEQRVLAEELQVLDGEDALWLAVRPLLDAVLRLDRREETFVWRGWQKSQIEAFLTMLPSSCSLVVGVWENFPATHSGPAQDKLVLGVVCSVEQGEICSLRTFASLVAAGLKSVVELEIGMEDALEIMHYARRQVAPVAWALFIEKTAWDEWIFTAGDDDGALDKGALLSRLAQEGRCVLMGSQATRQG
jgi:hypothetical protein